LAKANFHPIGDFFKPYSSRAKAGFKKITNWVKSGFLMMIPIYAKVSFNIKYAWGSCINPVWFRECRK